jgi:hypothetical protein
VFLKEEEERRKVFYPVFTDTKRGSGGKAGVYQQGKEALLETNPDGLQNYKK